MGEWRGKRVVVLGLARQGKALCRYLAQGGAWVTVSDLKAEDALTSQMEELKGFNLEYVLGEHPLSLLEGAETLFLSGGVPADLPLVLEARSRGIRVSNDAQLFLEASPALTVGITGSMGKTTTASLLGQIAERSFAGSRRRAWVGGNIGFPLLNALDKMKPDDLAILELSSFQLEIMTVAPDFAAWLNLRPDHIDRHKSMEAYQSAKSHILAYQSPEGVAVLNADDSAVWGMRDQVRGRLLAFGTELPAGQEGGCIRDGVLCLRLGGQEQTICALEEVALRGTHNRMNLLAACVLGAAAGLRIEAMREVARTFRGVPHRLEWVRRVRGADWYNDSIATTPDRALAALRAFDEPIVLLAGGRDKDLPWDAFAREVVRRVKHAVLFGEAAEKIARHLQAAAEEGSPPVTRVSNLEAAVAAAAAVAEPGDVVLLAPGGTSFDEFENYEERGEVFRTWVEAL